IIREPPGRPFTYEVMRREWQDRGSKARVLVSVASPTIRFPDEVALPARRRTRRHREAKSDLVPRVHDYVALVALVQQFADIAEAGVETSQVAPALAMDHLIIVGNLGGAFIHLGNFKVAAVAQLGGLRRGTVQLRLAGVQLRNIAQEIPVYLHVGSQTETTADSGPFNAVQANQHVLVAACGKAQFVAAHFPATF